MKNEEIIFDLNPTEVLTNLNSIEQYYYDFFKEHQTFNGWLLTLNDEEFEAVLVDFKIKKGKDNNLPPKFKLLEVLLEGKKKIGQQEFTDDLVSKAHHLTRINLCRMGYAKYTQAEDDKDWKYKYIKDNNL